MITHYKGGISKAARMLHALKDDPTNVGLLFELQQSLVRWIKHSERSILRLKEAANALKSSLSRDRLPKDEASIVKAKIKTIFERVNEYKHLIFIWKCFGDGVANIYFDKYSLKHAFFSVEEYSPKESAGFLSGKDGFKIEWQIVKRIIRTGEPILLCDITNVLRHGDICLMGANDPFLIEVKSSKNRNDRVTRQVNNLAALHKFYNDDRADDFRGLQNVLRVALDTREINHIAAINDCIERSYSEGTTIVTPESGVHYVSVVGELDKAKVDAVMSKSTALFFLNSVKRKGIWAPYFPFTLSIQPDHLYGFIKGTTSLIVLIDLKVLKKHFKAHGVHAVVLKGGPWALQLSKDPKDLKEGVVRVSEHLFCRVPFEFQSLQWFVAEHARTITDISKRPSEQDGITFEIPESWYSDGDEVGDADQ
jgi:hypothetical protein